MVAVQELGHAVLYVRDVERSSKFYGEVLGWTPIMRPNLQVRAAAFSGGRTHHELLLIEVGDDAAPIPQGRRVGLYHLGLKIGDSDDDLREMLDRLRQYPDLVTIVGSADHNVSHSLYVLDPDGNEIELFVDDVTIDWRNDPDAFAQPVRPLKL